ncbi:unnamed protein product [Malus baccata var. baccata]
MSGLSDRCFNLNFGEEEVMSPQDNIYRLTFLSPTGLLTVGDSVIKNDMTAAVVARNLLTSKDNRLFSKRSDDLAVKDSLAFNVQCAGLFQRHLLPSSSRAVPRNEAPNDQPLMPHPSRVLSSIKAPNDHPPVPYLSGALPTAETSPEQPL